MSISCRKPGNGREMVMCQVHNIYNSLQSIYPAVPDDATAGLFSKFAAANLLIPNLSSPLPVKWLKKLGIHELPGGLKVEDFDYLHTLIYIDEVSLVLMSYRIRS